jgi:hypothetical protein
MGRRIVVTALLVGVAVTACGHGRAEGPGVGTAFRAKAAQVCRSALAMKRAQGPFPYPAFNPTRPNVAYFPEIARFELGTIRTYRAWLGNMVALGLPPTGRDAWSDLLTAIRAHVDITVDQAAAAQRGDADVFTRTSHEGTKTQDDLLRAAEAAGTPECAAVDR